MFIIHLFNSEIDVKKNFFYIEFKLAFIGREEIIVAIFILY